MSVTWPTMPANELGQPVGFDLGDWTPPPFPPGDVLAGRTVQMEPLDPSSHGPALWDALKSAPHSLWTYMAFGPFRGYAAFEAALESISDPDDWLPYTAVVNGVPLGFASFLRIEPKVGCIEIGSITWSPDMQRTTPSTEALYLMMAHVFELGYRRCEWKCDALNAPSRAAALRLGYTYEGTFRQATHYKGRNRDTAWYSIIDREWPLLAMSFQRWLSVDNFDGDGAQIRTLERMRGR